MKKKTIIFILALMLLGYPIAYKIGQASHSSMFTTISEEFTKQGEKIENVLNKIIAEKDSIIQKYETREEFNATIIRIRDIDIRLFKEVTVKITSNQEYPWSFFSTKYQLNPEIFGNFIEISDNINITYFYGTVGNKIKIENIDDKFIDITYSKSAFLTPYRINSRNVELNLGAKIMTTMENDAMINIINSVGNNQLSLIEDEFIKQIKAEYQDSNIPIKINGIPLDSWSSENKIFKEEDLDSEYTVSIQDH